MTRNKTRKTPPSATECANTASVVPHKFTLQPTLVLGLEHKIDQLRVIRIKLQLSLASAFGCGYCEWATAGL